MEPETPSDGHAIAGAGEGEATLGLRRRKLLGWFQAFGLRHHDAEDCTQDALVRVQAALGRYVARAPFDAFLRKVARTVYVDWCRRQRVRRVVRASLDSADAAAIPAPDSMETWQRLDLEAAVNRLPKKLGDVIELSVRQGLNHREVSEHLGIPIGTVKSRMHLAVKAMRKELSHES